MAVAGETMHPLTDSPAPPAIKNFTKPPMRRGSSNSVLQGMHASGTVRHGGPEITLPNALDQPRGRSSSRSPPAAVHRGPYGRPSQGAAPHQFLNRRNTFADRESFEHQERRESFGNDQMAGYIDKGGFDQNEARKERRSFSEQIGGALSSLFNFGSRPTTPQIHMTDSDNARGSGVGSGSGSGGDGESGGESDGGGPPSLEKAGSRRGSFSGRSGPLGGAAATEKKSRRAMMRLKHEAQGYEKMRKLPEGVLSMKPVRPNDFSEWHASVSQLQEMDVITIHVPDNYPFTGPETVFKGYTIRFVLGMSNLSENELHQNEVNNIFLVSWTPAQNLLDAVTSTQQLVRRFQVEDKEREQREVAAVKASAAIAKQSEADVGATEMETIPISVAPVAGNTPRPDDGGIGAAPIPGGLQTIQSAAEIESMLSEASTAGDDGGVGERGSTGAENSGVLGAAADTPPAHAEILT